MTKPIIAIDIDEVLADYSAEFVVMSNKLWGTKLAVSDYTEDWMGMWGVGVDEAVARGQILLEDRMHERLVHKDDATPVLEYLSQSYTLIIITARHINTKDVTLEWLGRHYPMIQPGSVTFAGLWDNPDANAYKRTKGTIAKELNVSYLIDDQLKHCFAVAEHGIEALLFGNYQWNQVDKLPAGVIRAINWSAVEDYFRSKS